MGKRQKKTDGLLPQFLAFLLEVSPLWKSPFHLEVTFHVNAAMEIGGAPAVLAVLFEMGRLPREMRSGFVGEER